MKRKSGFKLLIALTVALVAIPVIFASPVSAFDVSFTNPPSGVTGSKYNFQVTVTTGSDEAVTFQNINLNIFNTGNPVYMDSYTGLPTSTFTVVLNGTSSTAIIQATASTDFSGFVPGSSTITYAITWTVPVVWIAGSYEADLVVTTTNGSTVNKSAEFTVATAITGTGTVTWTPLSNRMTPSEIESISPDTLCTVTIPQGVSARDSQGNTISSISCNASTSTPPPPAAGTIVAAYDMLPAGTKFGPEISIAIKYDPAALKGYPESGLTISFYNTANDTWVPIDNVVVDTVNHRIIGQTSHFTLFAVVASPAATTTSTATTTTAPASSPPWGIIGEVVGGVIVIALVVFFLFRRKR